MSDFSQFDDKIGDGKPMPGKYASENAVKLTDGEYTVRVNGGFTKKVNEKPVVVLSFVILTEGNFDGWPVEKTYFMFDKTGERDLKRFDELIKDLRTMGFDCENWKAPERPFSAQLPIALDVMKGVELVIRKKSGGDQGQYANLYINKRVATDGKPAVFGPEEMVVPESLSSPDPVEAAASGEPVPF